MTRQSNIEFGIGISVLLFVLFSVFLINNGSRILGKIWNDFKSINQVFNPVISLFFTGSLCKLFTISVVMTTATSQISFMDKLVADDGAAGDRFGYSVSISGTHAIVGASDDDDKGSASGSAYIFSMDNETASWTQVAKLVADDGATGNYFGYSVSISGTHAIVGAYGDDDKGSDSGSAYIFSMDNETASWNQVVKLVADDGAAGDKFGYSVSISGTHAIVGAYWADSAYIFSMDNETASWNQVVKLVADDGAVSDYFGYSVSISGTHAIVGADYDDDKGSASGSAYIFSMDNETASWNQVVKLVADDGAANDKFGYSVSISGNHAIVCARDADAKASNSGSAYIFSMDNETASWNQVAKLVADDGAANDLFGISVSISGTHAIVGACYDNDKGSWSGSAYIFSMDNETSWNQIAKLVADDGAEVDRFGISVSISGIHAIVGAWGDDGYSGSAYVVSNYHSCNSLLDESANEYPFLVNWKMSNCTLTTTSAPTKTPSSSPTNPTSNPTDNPVTYVPTSDPTDYSYSSLSPTVSSKSATDDAQIYDTSSFWNIMGPILVILILFLN